MNVSGRKTGRDDRQPVGRLVELHLEQVRQRPARGVDAVDGAVELGEDALEVVGRVGLEPRHVVDLLAHPFEQAALGPDPEPQGGQVQTQLPDQPLLPGTRLQARLQQGVLDPPDLHLDRRERLEQRVRHPVEDHVDDVPLAAAGRDPALRDQLGQVEASLVHRHQEVAVDEDVDAHQRELPRGYLVRLVRRARAPERERSDRSRPGSCSPASPLDEIHEPLGGASDSSSAAAMSAAETRRIDPEELVAGAKLPDLIRIEPAQDRDPLRGHLAATVGGRSDRSGAQPGSAISATAAAWRRTWRRSAPARSSTTNARCLARCPCQPVALPGGEGKQSRGPRPERRA